MTATSGTLKTRIPEAWYGRAFAAALCIMPLLAMYAPRSTALGPPLIAFAGFILFCLAFREWPRLSRKAIIWALIFPALMAASAFWGIAPDHAFSRALKALPLLLGGAVLWDMGRGLRPEFAAQFRRYFPCAVIVMGVLCAVELYFDAPVFRIIHAISDSEKKFHAAQVNRSVVVFVLLALTAFFCSMADGNSDRRKNILAGTLGALAALVLYKTDSQSAQLAFLLGGFFYFAFPYTQKWAWEILCGVIALCVFAAPWIAEYLFDYIAQHADAMPWLQRGYAGQRFEIWDFIARAALERPWLGHGVEATREMTFNTQQLYYPGNTILHPHNFALQAWIEFGVLGAFTLAVFLCTLIRGMRSLPPEQARMVLPLLVASLSVASTGYGLWQGWWLGMFCLLFGYAALLLERRS